MANIIRFPSQWTQCRACGKQFESGVDPENGIVYPKCKGCYEVEDFLALGGRFEFRGINSKGVPCQCEDCGTRYWDKLDRHRSVSVICPDCRDTAWRGPTSRSRGMAFPGVCFDCEKPFLNRPDENRRAPVVCPDCYEAESEREPEPECDDDDSCPTWADGDDADVETEFECDECGTSFWSEVDEDGDAVNACPECYGEENECEDEDDEEDEEEEVRTAPADFPDRPQSLERVEHPIVEERDRRRTIAAGKRALIRDCLTELRTIMMSRLEGQERAAHMRVVLDAYDMAVEDLPRPMQDALNGDPYDDE